MSWTIAKGECHPAATPLNAAAELIRKLRLLVFTARRRKEWTAAKDRKKTAGHR